MSRNLIDCSSRAWPRAVAYCRGTRTRRIDVERTIASWSAGGTDRDGLFLSEITIPQNKHTGQKTNRLAFLKFLLDREVDATLVFVHCLRVGTLRG